MVGSVLLQGTLWFIFIIPRKNIWKDISNLLLKYYRIIFFLFWRITQYRERYLKALGFAIH